MSRCLDIEKLGNGQQFQQIALGTEQYFERHRQWLERNFHYMSRCLGHYFSILPLTLYLQLNITNCILEMVSERSLGLLQVFLIDINYEGLVQKQGEEKKNAPQLSNHAKKA